MALKMLHKCKRIHGQLNQHFVWSWQLVVQSPYHTTKSVWSASDDDINASKMWNYEANMVFGHKIKKIKQPVAGDHEVKVVPKRGRPKKSVDEIKQPIGGDHEVKVVPKRGRPKKIMAEIKQPIGGDHEVKVVPKRGRPRKIVDETKLDGEFTVKRKRGRPKKISDEYKVGTVHGEANYYDKQLPTSHQVVHHKQIPDYVVRKHDIIKSGGVEQDDTSRMNEIITFPFFSLKYRDRFRHVPETPNIYIPEVTERATFEDPFFPSVSTILNATQTPESRMVLERWRKKMLAEMGVEGFALHQKETLEMGSSFHNCVQDYLEDTPESQLNIPDTNQGHWQSLQTALLHVSNVRSIEKPVIHKELCYRGVFDCIADYRGKPCMIEWKTSKKPKPDIKSIYEYPLQLAAYAGAANHQQLCELQLDNLLIVVCYEDGQPAHCHLLEHRTCISFWEKWLQRVHQYWTTKVQEQSAIH